MPRVSYPSVKQSKSWNIGVAKATSISPPLRIHSTAQCRSLGDGATLYRCVRTCVRGERGCG